MNEAKRQSDVLTRDELDALLTTLAEDRKEGEGSAAPYRSEAAADAVPNPAVYRSIQQFAHRYSRDISNLHQARIGYELIDWGEVTMAEASARLLPTDRLVIFEMAPSLAVGFVLFGRPLLYALMSLEFGARPRAGRTRTPPRDLSAIERRVLRRLSQQTLMQLDDSWSEHIETRSRVVAIDGPERLLEDAHERVLLASIDVTGLGDVCRMRVGLPVSAFGVISAPSKNVQPERRAAVERLVGDMPVRLHAEVGSVEMTLSELSELREGEVIPIDAPDNGTLTVRIGGRAKFRGVRGSVGHRLAVQLTERL